ncbi:MAG: cytochrome c biogenesis protein DipZ [Gammaproteobacteria bacterium]|nr:MAG: cytochrome c biogenesis protein DipZ [Gammaproteobacteria bacterium]
MLLVLLVFLGGVLTILSPCILPVLPFVFARAGQPFVKSTLPLLIGMALTFAGIATLAAVGGAWAVQINQYGRMLALVLLVIFAATLLSRHLADWLAKPFVALGNRLLPSSGAATGVQSLVLGIATGLLWAPCAGPILGLVLTGALISGPNTQTTLLLFAYAAGAALSLGVAMFAGGRLLSGLKRNPGVSELFRRVLAVAVLVAVVAIVMGWDTSVLTRLSSTSTNQIEQTLIDKIHPEANPENSAAMKGAMAMSGNTAMNGGAMQGGGAMSGTNAMMSRNADGGAPYEGELPELDGVTSWLNSPPLASTQLRGKVLLIDFWTYSCINCLRALPYVNSWYSKYKDYGLVVIGVHSPEFAFEKDESNVKRAVKNLDINYPVALDNNYAIWQAFNNQYWPAHYFIDAQGKIRSHHFGEGKYDESEQKIRDLLTEAGAQNLPEPASKNVKASGVQAAADENNVKSPETYLGYERAQHFSSPEGFIGDESKAYTLPYKFELNDWALEGNWLVDKEKAVLVSAPGKLVFRFSARDLHLVLASNVNGKAVRFRVLLDGAAPAKNHGMDIDEAGNGVITEQRLYQLIRQPGDVKEHTFTIEFLDEGVQAFSFTFG